MTLYQNTGAAGRVLVAIDRTDLLSTENRQPGRCMHRLDVLEFLVSGDEF